MQSFIDRFSKWSDAAVAAHRPEHEDPSKWSQRQVTISHKPEEGSDDELLGGGQEKYDIWLKHPVDFDYDAKFPVLSAAKNEKVEKALGRLTEQALVKAAGDDEGEGDKPAKKSSRGSLPSGGRPISELTRLAKALDPPGYGLRWIELDPLGTPSIVLIHGSGDDITVVATAGE